jgi:putative membrane protein
VTAPRKPPAGRSAAADPSPPHSPEERGAGRRGRVPLHEIGEHPDYRFTLANERTFLAWIRTALALVAGGVAVVQLVPEFSLFRGGRHVLGVLLILLAIVVSGISYRRWQQNERALRLNQPLPPSRLPWLIAVGLVAITILALVLVVFSRGGSG